MQLSAIAKGFAIGAAAGTVGYLASRVTDGEKNRLKRRTVRAAHAVGAVMESVADLFR